MADGEGSPAKPSAKELLAKVGLTAPPNPDVFCGMSFVVCMCVCVIESIYNNRHSLLCVP